MIGKTHKRSNPLPVLKYLLSLKKFFEEDARIIGGTMIGETPLELVREFAAIKRLRPGVKRYIYHQSLRPVDGEGEALSDDTWLDIADDHARAMGYGDGQWVAVRHEGHVHIVGSRVLFDGSLVSDSYDWRRAESSVRAIEKKYGLTEVEPSHLLEPAKAKDHAQSFSQAEIALAQKGEASVRTQLQQFIETVLDRPQTLTEFADDLSELGVLVRPNVQSTGRLAGLSFALRERPGLEFAGGNLGRKFSLNNLMTKGLTYDKTDDREGIGRCRERCEAARSRSQDGRVPVSQNRSGTGSGRNRRAPGRGDRLAHRGDRDDPRSSPEGNGNAGGLAQRAQRADRQSNRLPGRSGPYPDSGQPPAGEHEEVGPKTLGHGASDGPPSPGDRSSLDHLLALVGRPRDAEWERRNPGAWPTGAGSLSADAARAPSSVPAASGEPDRPLSDPAEAKRHLQAVKGPVELAVRYPDSNRIRVLAVIDHRTLGTWARRLRRRSALGQEPLIRPAKGSPMLLLPRQTEQQTAALRREGINPAVTVATEWNRQDVWVGVTGGIEGDTAEALRAALIEGGLCSKNPGDRPWGHLAGYRPNPRATTSTRAQLLSNRVLEMVDSVVEVTRELVDRLRNRAKRRSEQERTPTPNKGPDTTRGRGRSR